MRFNLRERRLLKMARYGQDTVSDDEIDQLMPWWNPYGERRKSPNDAMDTKNKPGDTSFGGPQDGSIRDPEQDGINKWYEGMKEETLTDQFREGVINQSPSGMDAPLDTVIDPPLNNGEGTPQSGMTEAVHSPIGEHDQAMRRVEDADPNRKIKDNHSGRLPGSRMVLPPKPFNRMRRSEVLSALEQAWAWQLKKG